jgi:hypothetical protein
VNAKKKVSSCGGTGHSRCGEVHRATVRSASMRSNPFSLQVIILCAAPSSVPHPTCLAQDSRAFPPWPCAPLLSPPEEGVIDCSRAFPPWPCAPLLSPEEGVLDCFGGDLFLPFIIFL